jgi:hypothetical protein
MPDIPEEFEDADVLQTLGMMYAEMYQTRVELQKLNQKLEGDNSGVATCTKCNTTVNIDNRQEHLKQEHNAPDGVDVSVFFE